MEFNVLDQVEANLLKKKVSIVDFAEDPAYCGKTLYPYQRLALKLIFLEDRTDYEEMLLDKWIESKEVDISPQIRERVEWLKENGYKHFREIVMVGGRRSSKGFLTGMVMAKKMYDTLQLQDPNRHYGIDPNKEIYFSCVAASEKQAKELQYADFASTVNSCTAMQQDIKKVQELEFSVMTDADKRKLREWQVAGRRIQRDISKLRGKALPANSRTIRGYTSMGIVFDEMAFFMQGDSDQSDEEVYEAAIPSLAQFGTDGILFCNSSPYTKVGKFYERYEEAMELENDKPLAPMMLGMRFPSWSMFEEWWSDSDYQGAKKCITVSPDWDADRKNDEGELFYSQEDRQAIAVERNQERDNPEKFKVERRAQFASTVDAYLVPEMVDRMFAGKPLANNQGYTPMQTNWSNSTYRYKYKAHLDPSSTTAGFGFALGHVEEFDVGTANKAQHVVFDIIKRWNPKDFGEGVINWEYVLPEVLHYIDLFRPYEITFDQFQSSAPIQWLRKELRAKGIDEVRVYEKTATASYNWNRAEVFKTALYQGAVHAPYDTDDVKFCALELKYLQELRTGRIPRVEKQDVGPVTTKDMADCVMEVTEALIGNVIANQARDQLGSEPPRFGAPGGYSIGGPNKGGKGDSPFSDYYTRRSGEQATYGSRAMNRKRAQRNNPARRPWGGRPIPRKLPGW